jgi:L-seryl-tRNA(Ser) seleniumtransferase
LATDHPARKLPGVDQLLQQADAAELIRIFGRTALTKSIRLVLDQWRRNSEDLTVKAPTHAFILEQAAEDLARHDVGLKRLINLTGTMIHTNLGRAALPETAIQAMLTVASNPTDLEYDLETGQRGDRDHHIESLITEITGAEAATVVNNNAAAVMLVLNTLAYGRQVPVSRGELVEIGGSFRVPEIMTQSGCSLVEVGSTNRTHSRDFKQVIGPDTALLMKVHTSNYQIQGFTKSVPEEALAQLATENGIPLMSDLGSGTLVDLRKFNLPYEPTVQEAVLSGAHIITFSGDKLLGGPQAGVIIGRKELIDKIKANPMKRALRVDKMTLAALCEVLKLYRNPEQLSHALPTLKLLSRSPHEIEQMADKLLPEFKRYLEKVQYQVNKIQLKSQIGSGSMPLDLLASWGLSISPETDKGADQKLRTLAEAFRQLPVPVIGRIHHGHLLFDLRTIFDPTEIRQQLSLLAI